MAKIEELHTLVHTMDERERRLFKRELGAHLRHGKSNYRTLFDALLALPVYSEVQLYRKVQAEGLLEQLPSLTTRLFTHVVDFLRSSEEHPQVDAQLNAYCESIALLYERGLFGTAQRLLKKAQQLALHHDNYLQLLRLSDLERNYFFSVPGKAPEDSKDAHRFRDKEYLQALLQQVETKLLHFDALFYTKTGGIGQDGASMLLRKLAGRNPHATIRKAQESATELMLLDGIGLCAQLEGDFDLAFSAYSRMDSFWVSNPAKISDNARLYVGYITSFLNSCIHKARYAEFRNLFANLKTVNLPRKADNLRLKETLLYLELLFCLNRFDYERAAGLGPEVEQLLQTKKVRLSVSRVITYYFNMCSVHFMRGEYSKANRWLNQLIHTHTQDYRKDVLEFAPVFQLLLFVAMNDQDLVATRLRARLRHRAGRPKPSAVESAILALCAKFLKASAAEFQDAIGTFALQIQSILDSGQQVAGAGECLFWAEGQLRGKLPGEVFKEYAQAHQG